MIDEGRQIFRFDTSGSEALWGDALQLQKAIERRDRQRGQSEDRVVGWSEGGKW